MDKIDDIDIYNKRMAKTMEDKLFFVKEVDYTRIDKIVDYGCSDGTLLSLVKADWEKIGIDMNQDMLDLAKEKVPNGKFIKSITMPVMDGSRSLLNLSSVFHEVYSYCSPAELATFWENIYESNFDYIVIRDMATSVESSTKSCKSDVEKVRKSKWSEQAIDFEKNFGSIEYQKNLTHFLLKYRYKENWKREVKENYFSLTPNDFVSKFSEYYDVTYRKEYCLPFIYDKVKEDFGIRLQNTTHLQLILKRKKY